MLQVLHTWLSELLDGMFQFQFGSCAAHEARNLSMKRTPTCVQSLKVLSTCRQKEDREQF